MHHLVALDRPLGHRVRVTLRLPRPAAAQGRALPTWRPGNGLVREFAHRVRALEVWQGDQRCAGTALDKQRRPAPCSGRATLRLHHRVVALYPSVRGAGLDSACGFFNGAAWLLQVPGRVAQPQRLTLRPLPEGWQVATAMRPCAPSRPQAAAVQAFVAADDDRPRPVAQPGEGAVQLLLQAQAPTHVLARRLVWLHG